MHPTPAAVQATADFYRAGPGLRLFRLALGTVQRVWPALAARAAYRLFATPLPHRGLQRRPAWARGWQVQRWPFEDASLTLYTPAPSPADPPRPQVLLVHGWGGHAGQMHALAQALAAQGLRPVLLELPAHGASAGRTSTLPQFARAIEYAAGRLQREGELHAVVAHSLAANAAAWAIARGTDPGRLVLLAPPASARAYTRLFAQVFGLREAIRARMQALIEAREAVLIERFEPWATGPRVGVPTLVVHDRQDRINPHADGAAFAQAIPGARLLTTEGLGHRRLLQDAGVLAQVCTFLRRG